MFVRRPGWPYSLHGARADRDFLVGAPAGRLSGSEETLNEDLERTQPWSLKSGGKTRIWTLTCGSLSSAASRLHWGPSRVTVNLDDVNGPRGGVDKQCRILVSLRRGTPVKVEDMDVDLASAVGRAADRAGNAVARRVERRRQHKGA